jgi:polysaccharide chain length determinant protein (PEP-CTERM system associated)
MNPGRSNALNEPEVLDEEVSLTETVTNVVRLLLRRRWWILSSLFLVTLPAIAVILWLPNRFTSQATLVVVRQQVSQRFVEPISVTTIAEELNAMKMEVLSRKRLLEIIEAFGLYPEERETLSPDRLVELMRKDISVEPIAAGARSDTIVAFTVSFLAATPRIAQEVTGRLASLFIEENLRTQGSQATATTKFLSDQVETAKRRLAEQEQKLKAFKMSNFGALPEQQQTNLNALTDLRIQLQEVSARVGRAQQQRVYLESALSGQLAKLQSERKVLLGRFTPQHPEVQRTDRAIEGTTALLTRLRTGRSEGESLPLPADDPFLAQLQSQVEANVAELAQAPLEEQRLKAQIAQYQGRLNLTPVREQQLTALMRDYDLYKKDYTDLLDKQLSSELASKLEQQQGGQHYRLIDPPTLPTTPSSPKRLKLSLGAAAAGLLLGIALAFLRDLLDRSFHTEKELRDHLKAPLVVGIPLLLTPREERGRKLKLGVEWVAGSAIVLTVLAAEFYVFRQASMGM